MDKEVEKATKQLVVELELTCASLRSFRQIINECSVNLSVETHKTIGSKLAEAQSNNKRGK